MRSLLRGALALLIAGVVSFSVAHAGGPRETLLLDSNVEAVSLTEHGYGVGALRKGHGRRAFTKPSLFDLSGKRAKSWPYTGSGYGSAIARDDAGNVLAVISSTRRGYLNPVIIRASGSLEFLPGDFIPTTMTSQGVIVGTGLDWLREQIYPVRRTATGLTEIWAGENAWAVDANFNGDVLIQFPEERNNNGDVITDPTIAYWGVDGSVNKVGKGYAIACSSSGRYVVASYGGNNVRYDCRSIGGAGQTFLAPLPNEGEGKNWTYASDVTDTGEVVGTSNGKAAHWAGHVGGGTIPLNYPMVMGVTEATELSAMLKLPRGYVAYDGYRIASSGAMLVRVSRGRGLKTEYRTAYVRPEPIITLPRPLQ